MSRSIWQCHITACRMWRGEARRGEARRGEARRGEARRGEARRAKTRKGEVREGEARRDQVRSGRIGSDRIVYCQRRCPGGRQGPQGREGPWRARHQDREGGGGAGGQRRRAHGRPRRHLGGEGEDQDPDFGSRSRRHLKSRLDAMRREPRKVEPERAAWKWQWSPVVLAWSDRFGVVPVALPFRQAFSTSAATWRSRSMSCGRGAQLTWQPAGGGFRRSGDRDLFGRRATLV